MSNLTERLNSAVAGRFRIEFHVMPFIEGETLRATLDRETQLGT